MQTALHILSLVAELKAQAVGGRIFSAEYYRKERAAYLFLKNGKNRLCFGFSYHPHGSGSFLVPASKLKINTTEKPRPFFDLIDCTLDRVEQIGFDRLIRFTLIRENKTQQVVVEAIGPNGNLWFLDKNDTIQASLRRREFDRSAPYSPPSPPHGLNPQELTPEQLKSDLIDLSENDLAWRLPKTVLGLNRTLAREVANRLSQREVDPTPENVAGVIAEITERFLYAEAGFVYRRAKGIEVYPLRLGSIEEQPERLKTLSLAVLKMTVERRSGIEEEDEHQTVIKTVRRSVKRLEGRLKKIDRDLNDAADYERYRRLGELLQIGFDKLKRGMEAVTVVDVFDDTQPEIEIKLDPAITPRENVEHYFRRYRKGREGLGIMQRRRLVTDGELESVREILADLETDFDSASQKHRADIDGLLPASGSRDLNGPRLPFKKYILSTGVTIYVGRDGSDNDRTTFDYARPYELWFHAQQCPGSHVVIKYPNKSFEPSKPEIEETAAIAAWYSKARHDTLVPVIYTERKFVRKPRKAKPGLVTVEREKSVMVVPAKPSRTISDMA